MRTWWYKIRTSYRLYSGSRESSLRNSDYTSPDGKTCDLMASHRIPPTLHVAGEPRRSCASCSTRRRRHPPAPLLGNRSSTARVYTDLLRLATRQHQEAASRCLPMTSSSSTWRPGARNHALPRHTVGASLPFRTATGAVTARRAALPPLAALRFTRLVVFARQSWRRRVSASFIDSTGLLSSNACSAAAAAAAALRDPASSFIELPEPADVVVLSVSDAQRI
jgi:hypothetical protein